MPIPLKTSPLQPFIALKWAVNTEDNYSIENTHNARILAISKPGLPESYNLHSRKLAYLHTRTVRKFTESVCTVYHTPSKLAQEEDLPHHEDDGLGCGISRIEYVYLTPALLNTLANAILVTRELFPCVQNTKLKQVPAYREAVVRDGFEEPLRGKCTLFTRSGTRCRRAVWSTAMLRHRSNIGHPVAS